jgi:hypothetical protein
MGLLEIVRPLNSEVHSASAGGPGFHPLPPGSLAAALTPTRPRRRFSCSIVRIFSTKGAGMSRGCIKTASVFKTESVLSLYEMQ